MSSPINSLTKKDIFEIGEFAKDKRRHFDIGMLPIGDNIFKLIRKEKIYLIYTPIEVDDNRDNNFSAIYVCLRESGEEISYIGLNTADYLDKQIFALAHELFHHFEKCQLHICRSSDEEKNNRELKANLFAAEFLLPTEKLETEIKEANDGDINLTKWKHSALLRQIARLHCEYRLPYKAIVRRLQEIGSISQSQYSKLYVEKVRDSESDYYQIGCSMNEEIFKMLNTKSRKTGVDGNDLEKIIRNYEDGLISISELADTLPDFNKSLADFGLEEKIDPDDLADLGQYY